MRNHARNVMEDMGLTNTPAFEGHHEALHVPYDHRLSTCPPFIFLPASVIPYYMANNMVSLRDIKIFPVSTGDEHHEKALLIEKHNRTHTDIY
jgi:hypothetical protein